MLDFKPESRKTDIGVVLRYFTNVMKKRCTAFIISDWITTDYENDLMIAGKKHDMVCLHVYDVRDTDLPAIGWIKLKDAETGEYLLVNTNDRRMLKEYRNNWEEAREQQKHALMRSGIDNVYIEASEDYVKALIGFFKLENSYWLMLKRISLFILCLFVNSIAFAHSFCESNY